MKLAFTICANNYLAQAKTLVESFLEHNPGYQFVVGLVDEWRADLDKSFLGNCEILEVSKIGLKDIEGLLKKYEIVEFSTAVKASYFKYLFARDEKIEAIIYLDPDIMVFDRFHEIEKALQTSNVILTPHMLTPKKDLDPLLENDVIANGTFNLGFIAIARSAESFSFLDWWEVRLEDRCFMNKFRGLCFDQFWLNLAPVYFEKVYIEKHPGYNVAYWNFYERSLSKKGGGYLVNEKVPLVFLHLSNFDFDSPHVITRAVEGLSLKNRENFRPLFEEYRERLARNRYQELRRLTWAYAGIKRQTFKQKVLAKFGAWLKLRLRRIHEVLRNS